MPLLVMVRWPAKVFGAGVREQNSRGRARVPKGAHRPKPPAPPNSPSVLRRALRKTPFNLQNASFTVFKSARSARRFCGAFLPLRSQRASSFFHRLSSTESPPITSRWERLSDVRRHSDRRDGTGCTASVWKKWRNEANSEITAGGAGIYSSFGPVGARQAMPAAGSFGQTTGRVYNACNREWIVPRSSTFLALEPFIWRHSTDHAGER